MTNPNPHLTRRGTPRVTAEQLSAIRSQCATRMWSSGARKRLDLDKRKENRKIWEKTPAGRKAILRNRQQNKARRIKANTQVIGSAKDKPCADCGHQFPRCCMDFHHIVGEKRFSVGKGTCRATSTLIKEIAKCIVICSNCHRIRHHGKV